MTIEFKPDPFDVALESIADLREQGHLLRALVRLCLSLGYTSRAGKPLALTQVARPQRAHCRNRRRK